MALANVLIAFEARGLSIKIDFGFCLKIFAVIPCYRPDIARLTSTCERVIAAGIRPLLVNNSEHGHAAETVSISGCLHANLGKNVGIARAQNIGIEMATREGADAVLFLDQDSLVDADCLENLKGALAQDRAMVIGPVCIDEASGVELPSVRLGFAGLPKATRVANCIGPQKADVLISSGTLATRQALAVVGPMDEDLFIDFVDTDWCLRCRAKDVTVEVIPSAVMRHSIGIKSMRVWRFTLLVHSPFRCYYQVRNCFVLFRRKHVPLAFAIHQSITTFASRCLLLLFVPEKRKYARAYLAAVRDGAIALVTGVVRPGMNER
jgi:rhamnosyltransferase